MALRLLYPIFLHLLNLLMLRGRSSASKDIELLVLRPLQRIYLLFVLEVPSRFVHLLGTTTNPDSRGTTQQIRNLVMNLGDRVTEFRFLVCDRAGQFAASFDAVLADVGLSRWSGLLPGARRRTVSPNGSCARSEPNSPAAC